MYKLNETKYYYDESDNIGVLIDFTSGTYFSLNKIGTAIFNRLNEGASADDVVKHLNDLEGCPNDIDKDIDKFIDNLSRKEIVVSDEAKNKCKHFSKEDVEDGFIPVADEFNDVQDLIMADPVHDINEDKGWPVIK